MRAIEDNTAMVRQSNALMARLIDEIEMLRIEQEHTNRYLKRIAPPEEGHES